MWTDDLFGVKKPIIALLHLRALPGDPLFCGNMDDVIESAKKDLRALQEGGVDGVLIANEFSLPYQVGSDVVTVASMAYLVGRIRDEIKVPFGVNVVLDPDNSLELAAATGASFIRSAFSGAYMGEYGLVNTHIGDLARRKKALGLDNLKMLFKVNPESDSYLTQRDIKVITKSIIFGCYPDGLCVSGASAGSETDTELLQQVKSVSSGIPVFCNTGFNADTAEEKLKYCDAACVGTAFKYDGIFENDVDVERVASLMDKVKAIRKTLL